MVNTVGSCKTNKFWNKKWIPIKESLSLSQEQKELIIGSLLGDGTMRLGKGAKNANFKVEHGLLQKDYVFWKYHKLKEFVFTEPKMSFRYEENGVKYPKSWWFRTIRHPELTKIYNLFYKGNGYLTGKKIIPDSLKKFLTPVALAVWIMDDGCFNKKAIDISTYSFSFQEIQKLRSILKEIYGINVSFYKDRAKGYRLLCHSRKSTIASQSFSIVSVLKIRKSKRCGLPQKYSLYNPLFSLPHSDIFSTTGINQSQEL